MNSIYGQPVASDLAAALLRGDLEQARKISEGIPSEHRNRVAADLGASVAGFLVVRFLETRAESATPTTLRDRQIAKMVMAGISEIRPLTRTERASIKAAAPAMVRQWQDPPDLWQGGGHGAWVYLLIAAMIQGLTSLGAYDAAMLTAEWVRETASARANPAA